jgi:DNA-binding XRE family transcriptional regulator
MRHRTLKERSEGYDRSTEITLTVSIGSLIRLEGFAHDIGLSREEALLDAISLWSVRREQSINRSHHLAIRKAMDKQPIAELLERFRKQMEGSPVGSWAPAPALYDPESPGDGCVTKSHKDAIDIAPRPARLSPMTTTTEPRSLRERRESLGLSRERLARLADVSMASIAQFEAGLQPKESRVLGLLEAALSEQERIAA